MQPKDIVIFADSYIDELTRHRDIWKERYEVEDMPNVKLQCGKKYKEFDDKLNWALDFQDVVESIKNEDIPQITLVKTTRGYELPAKYLMII